MWYWNWKETQNENNQQEEKSPKFHHIDFKKKKSKGSRSLALPQKTIVICTQSKNKSTKWLGARRVLLQTLSIEY